MYPSLATLGDMSTACNLISNDYTDSAPVRLKNKEQHACKSDSVYRQGYAQHVARL